MYPYFVDQQGFWRSQEYSSNVLVEKVDPSIDTEKRVFPFSYSMIDCWFPLIHGEFGEDGELQHQMAKTETPYIGSDESVSLTCYDKIKSRQKAALGDVCQPQFLCLEYPYPERNGVIEKTIMQELGLPCFIKPAKTGSSFGISKVNEEREIIHALEIALNYDKNIIVEKAINNCLEYEIAFIGNKRKKFSIPGTIEYEDEFYTTQAKYSNNSTKLKALKTMNQTFKKKIYDQTQKIVDLFNVKDLGRVDFLYDQENDILYWNEINTIPGFTEKSMFPFLWKEEGLGIEEVIDLIIAQTLC